MAVETPTIEQKGQATVIEAQFQRLTVKWKAECPPTSSSEKLAMHPLYQRIIGLGPDALPSLFRELERSPHLWYWALRAITGENPVAPSNRGNLKAMAEDWLAWAKANGYEW